jgi:hypothetical protein
MIEYKKNINYKGKYFGIDSPSHNEHNKHFKNYPLDFDYTFNSQGFRGDEWPDDLSDCVFCFGDSFTLGVGQPYNQTWPFMLSEQIDKKCLNVGIDGCSNDRMSLLVDKLRQQMTDPTIVIMWSFLHRRMVNGQDVQYAYHDKTNGLIADIENFEKNFSKVNQNKNVINLIIPNCLVEQQHDQNILKNVLLKRKVLAEPLIQDIFFVKQRDNARDDFHFGPLTSADISGHVKNKISI